MKLDESDVVKLYERMFTVRYIEDRLQKKCDDGEAGDLHFNRGQEAIAVGVCEVLDQRDYMVTHHRTIAHQVARGADLKGLIAELLGKRTGCNSGRAGEMHITNRTIGHVFSFQLVGTCIPVACGYAWSLKNHYEMGYNRVVAVFFGDAASSNGQFHEGLSMAAIHKLPILFVCENNHRAGNIEPRHYMPGVNVSQRVEEAYGISAWSIDGNSIESVVETAKICLDAIRNGGGPRFIECHTERLCFHKQGQRDVRSKEELEKLAQGEPLVRIEASMSPSTIEKIRAKVKKSVDLVFEIVDKDPSAEMLHE